MRAPIGVRLRACADLIPACETVADVGTDHGYLGVFLLQSGVCRRVLRLLRQPDREQSP